MTDEVFGATGQDGGPAIGPAIALEGVSVRYGAERDDGGLLAVDDVSLSVGAGEFVSVVGPSGCGKSTLLRVVAGLLAPTAGRVSVLGEAPRAAQRSKRLGLVFQEPALLPWRTVAGNVALPREVNRRGSGGSAEPSVGDLLGTVGLSGFANYHPHELSGGMQQRVALARALAVDPAVLVMDEPFAALDEITRESMRFELLRIWGEASARRKTVLFVTHAIAEAVLLSDRVVVLSARPGRVQAVVEVGLARPRQAEDQRSTAFLDLVDGIRELLRDERPSALVAGGATGGPA